MLSPPVVRRPCLFPILLKEAALNGYRCCEMPSFSLQLTYGVQPSRQPWLTLLGEHVQYSRCAGVQFIVHSLSTDRHSV